MASEHTILSWNVTNWITVILMAAIGFGILAVAEKIVMNARSKSGAAA